MDKMTEKQKRFCDEYIVCLNATQAAIKAGYSEKTANVIGAENLTKPYIREYIDKRLAEIESELIADQKEVMQYLTSVMRREKQESVVVTLSKEQSKYEPDENGTMRKRTVKEEFAEVVKIPTQIRDSNKAAELLGRAYGIYTERVAADVDMELNITVDYGDD